MPSKSTVAALGAALVCTAFVHPLFAYAQRAGGAWTTSCAASHCSASTRVRTNQPGVPYAYQLRVSRYGETRTELVFLTGQHRPADDAAIAIQIDGKAVTDLRPGTGYRRVGRSNTFVIAEGETGALLAAMRSGRKLGLSFRTPAGADEAALLSLEGMDAALTRIGVVSSPPLRTRPRVVQTPRADVAAPSAPASSIPTAPASSTPTAPVSSTPTAPAPTTVPDAELPAPALDGPGAPPAAAPAPSAAPESVSVPRQFACQGNEPFWNLSIDGERARFVSLTGSGDPQPVLLTGRLQATAEATGATFGWRGRSADGHAYGALIERRACRDSMSDREGVTTFAYSATVAAPGGRTLQGCCNAGLSLDRKAGTPGEPSVQLSGLRGRAPEDWSRHLPDMLRAIHACLERTPGEGAYVTKAWPMNRGLVGVRTRNASVGWFDCIAQQDGRAIEQFAPVDNNTQRIADEEKVLFVPVSGARHDGNCFRHEQVLDEAGRPLGWLSANTCWRAPGAPAAKRK